MTVRDLDRLVTKTDLNPVSKRALREVRHAVISGDAGDAQVGKAHWSIGLTTRGGLVTKMSFSFQRKD